MVVIASDHTTIDYSWVVAKANHVLDTRNATRGVETNRDRLRSCNSGNLAFRFSFTFSAAAAGG